MARKQAAKGPHKNTTLKALTARRQKLQESVLISQLERTQKLIESYYVDDFTTSDMWERTRGRNRAGRRVPPSQPYDRRGGRNYPIWQTITELTELQQHSRVAVITNAYAKGLLRNLVNYCVGDGFDYSAVAVDQDKLKPGEQLSSDQEQGVGLLQQFIDGFLVRNRWSGDPDPFDAKAVAGTREREAYRRLHRDGEVFLRLFHNTDGSTDVRFIEPEQIRDPEGARYEEGWSFGIKHFVHPENGWHDVERVEWYHVVYPDNQKGEDVPAAEVVHIKNLDDDAAITRGTPSFAFDTLDALERASKVQRNSSISAAIRAATAEIWEHNFGSKADIEAMVTGLASKQIEDPERSPNKLVNLEYLDPGAIRRIPEGQKLVQPPTTTGVPEHLQAAQGDLRQAGCSFNAPEFLASGDASNANYASTKEAGTPFVVAEEAEQNHFRSGCLAVLYRAARHAKDKGRLPENIFKLARIQCEPPQIKQRDPLQAAQAAEIYSRIGVSPQTLIMEAGYDKDTEKANRQEWQDQFGASNPFPMPGQGDQGGGSFFESLLLEAFDESKVKRDHGKFSSTGGAGGSGDDAGGGDASPQPQKKGLLGRLKGAVAAVKNKVGAFFGKLDQATDVAGVKQVKGIFKGALGKIAQAQKALYGVMERRYGPKAAKAIFIAAQATGSNPKVFPLWFVAIPGSTLIAQLPLMGVAEGILQASRGAKAVGRGVKSLFASEEQELGQEEINKFGQEVADKMHAALAAWVEENRKAIEAAMGKLPEDLVESFDEGKVNRDHGKFSKKAGAKQAEHAEPPPGVDAELYDQIKKQVARGDDIAKEMLERWEARRSDPKWTKQAPKQDAPAGHAEAFEKAFDKLDKGHNLVSMVDLRKELGLPKEQFDGLVHELRKSGKWGAAALEGRHGITPEERDAAIVDPGSDGALLGYMQRKR